MLLSAWIALFLLNPSHAQENPSSFIELSKRVVPGVVNIRTVSKAGGPATELPMDSPEEFFRRFFENFLGPQQGPRGLPPGLPPGHPAIPRAIALGTGFVVDASGLILTNNHVVSEAEEIRINFTEEPGDTGTEAKVVGRDPELDVALIQVNTKEKLVPLVLGDSDKLQVGEYVAAIGNPFGQGHSVTHGIVSAKGRPSPEFPLVSYIQTDAPINPGNSGGPLVNLKGEVIGINNAIHAQAQGIGFAIPANLVKQVLPQLKSKGTVTRGYIGALVGDITPELAEQLHVKKDLQAPFITHVFPGSPAEKAGAKPYDVIVEFAGKRIQRSSELIAAVTSLSVGQSASLKILRDGKERMLELKVAERPGIPVAEESTKRPQGKKEQREAGLSLQDLTPEIRAQLRMKSKAKGVLVVGVQPGSPAFQAGLQPGDVILEIARDRIESVRQLRAKIKGGKSYLIRIRRVDPSTGAETFAVTVLDLRRH